MDSADEALAGREISAEDVINGQWIVPPVSYVNPTRRFCALTGRPIARGYWQVIVDGEELVFTDRDHALLYTTYPIRPNTQDTRAKQAQSCEG